VGLNLRLSLFQILGNCTVRYTLALTPTDPIKKMALELSPSPLQSVLLLTHFLESAMRPHQKFKAVKKLLAVAIALSLGQAANALEISPYFQAWSAGTLASAKSAAGLDWTVQRWPLLSPEEVALLMPISPTKFLMLATTLQQVAS
jgi:hypothetical protein